MTSSSEKDILMYMWLKLRKRRKRKWIHEFNESCAQHGAYVLEHDLLNDPVKFQSYYRMSPESYKELFQRVSPLSYITGNFPTVCTILIFICSSLMSITYTGAVP
jgi:hypothetical protein